MKKTIILLALAGFIAACGGNSTSDEKLGADSANAAEQSAASRQSEAVDDTARNNIGTEHEGGAGESKGAQLIAKSDCLTCHKEKEKLIGPAYADVAKKYDSNDENINRLADKIMKGGAGNWGDIPMTPHPNLSLKDAQEMAKYVLSLK